MYLCQVHLRRLLHLPTPHAPAIRGQEDTMVLLGYCATAHSGSLCAGVLQQYIKALLCLLLTTSSSHILCATENSNKRKIRALACWISNFSELNYLPALERRPDFPRRTMCWCAVENRICTPLAILLASAQQQSIVRLFLCCGVYSAVWMASQ